MPRDGAIIFRDIAGKLAVLRVECDKCGRFGRYRVDRLIERYGIDAKLFDWSDEITANCPRKSPRTCMTLAARGAPICRRWCKKAAQTIGGGRSRVGSAPLISCSCASQIVPMCAKTCQAPRGRQP